MAPLDTTLTVSEAGQNSGVQRFLKVLRLGSRWALLLGAGLSVCSQPASLVATRVAGGRVEIRWYAEGDRYVLEESETLDAAAAWSVHRATPGRRGAEAFVTVNAGGASTFYRLRWVGEAEGLPPEPASVAPPLAGGVVSDLATAVEFLFSGPAPIQTGMTQGTLRAVQASVLRGTIRSADGSPQRGVQVRVLGHPEFGSTLSRSNGGYDLAVNGGGWLTLGFEKSGYVGAQRTVKVPWQEYVTVPDVILLPADPEVTEVVLGALAPTQVARGSVVTDEHGPRQATLLVPAGTSGELLLPDGTRQAMAALRLRATEVSVGANGPAAMPALLPPTSGYTYCVELQADEATALGANSVVFDRPLPFYVENFLGMPVGIGVPTAYYDRARKTWVPVKDGRVIRVLEVEGGMARLDVEGRGQAADSTTLEQLGINVEELRQLASLYPPGQTLWRVPIEHLTPYDLNYGVVPRAGASAPNQPAALGDLPTDAAENRLQNGYGTVEVENLVFRETIPVAGAPFTLNYSSDRVPGRKAAERLVISLSGETVPEGVRRIDLELSVAGQVVRESWAPRALLEYEFQWNGRDAYGREVLGAQPVLVRIGYVYDGFYALPPRLARTFGVASGVRIPGDIPSREPVILWQEYRTTVGHWQAGGVGLGGWTLNVHHVYDPLGQVIYYGSGGQRSAANISQVVETLAGTGSPGFSGDGGPAFAASLNGPAGGTFGPDGSFYLADEFNHRIRRITPDGIITTVAGGGSGGDGAPALAARLERPVGVALGQDGTLYFPQKNHRVRKVTPEGIVVTIAGTGVAGFSGDGGPATQARLQFPQSVTVGPDNSLYVVDWKNHRVRKITPDGIISTVVGTGVPGFSGDGGPAIQAAISDPTGGFALGPDGSLYLGDVGNNRIRRVDPSGIIQTIAGNGTTRYSGDGGPAVLAGTSVGSVIPAPDGTIYYEDWMNNRLRRISPDGIISTYAGNGQAVDSGDGGPATDAGIRPGGLVVAPDGSLVVCQWSQHRVRRVYGPLPGFDQRTLSLPSEDGSQVYQFDANGRHLRTLHAWTGAVLYRFDYDARGRLDRVTDAHGNVFAIERGTGISGFVIRAPTGQRTAFGLDAQGYLRTSTNALGAVTRFESTPSGLLTAVIGPDGNRYAVQYDSLGRVMALEDPAGGRTTFEIREDRTRRWVLQRTPLGRTNQVTLDRLATGGRTRVMTGPDRISAQTLQLSSGSSTETFPDGTRFERQSGPDPRFGMLAPLSRSAVLTAPSGLAATASVQRLIRPAPPESGLLFLALTNRITLNGRTRTAEFQSTNRLLTLTSAEGRRQGIELDALGRVTARHVPGRGTVEQEYRSDGRLQSVTWRAGEETRRTTFAYDAHGFLAAQTNPLGQTLRFVHDAMGRLLTQIRPDGSPVQTRWDAAGNLVEVQPPGRPPHRFHYNALGLKTAYLPPAVDGVTHATYYVFDADRRLTQLRLPDGRELVQEYSPAGHLVRVGTPENTWHFQYDPTTGALAEITDSTGHSIRYERDGGLLTAEITSGAVTGRVARSYNASFLLRSLTLNDTVTQHFAYDADGLLTQAAGLVLTRNPQTGQVLSADLGLTRERWSYTPFDEIESYEAWVGGGLLLRIRYEYDAGGRLIAATEEEGNSVRRLEYAYDLQHRLVRVREEGAGQVEYEYDENGNRLFRRTDAETLSATYDEQDRLMTAGGTIFAYSANGDLTNRIAGRLETALTFGTRGELLAVRLPDGKLIEYQYDALLRRVARRVQGAPDRGYLYREGGRLVAELNASNVVLSTFVYGARRFVPDFMVRDGRTYRFFCDRLGSVRRVVEVESGALVQSLDYDEFGRVLRDTRPGWQPFGYAGGWTDPDTGWVHFGVRDYDPETGRWLSKDPLGVLGSLNLYAYAANSPVNLTDPTGTGPIRDPYRKLLNPQDLLHQADELLKDPIRTKLQQMVPKPLYTLQDIQYAESQIARIEQEQARLCASTAFKPALITPLSGEFLGGTSETQPLALPNEVEEGGGNPMALGYDISDRNTQIVIEQGAGGDTSLLYLEDPSYKLRDLDLQKRVYQEFIAEVKQSYLEYGRMRSLLSR